MTEAIDQKMMSPVQTMDMQLGDPRKRFEVVWYRARSTWREYYVVRRYPDAGGVRIRRLSGGGAKQEIIVSSTSIKEILGAEDINFTGAVELRRSRNRMAIIKAISDLGGRATIRAISRATKIPAASIASMVFVCNNSHLLFKSERIVISPGELAPGESGGDESKKVRTACVVSLGMDDA